MTPAANIARFWPQPWRYDPQGYCSGPAILDAQGQVICALFWPLHDAHATAHAERAMDDFCKALASINLIDGGQFDIPMPGEKPPGQGRPS